MLNQAALETLYAATYLDDYLDCVENLPDDIQRQLSKMLEIDASYNSLMRELETNMSYLLNDKDDDPEASKDEKSKKKVYSRIQQILIKTQELGDEKLQIGQQVQDLVDNKARQLELDKKNLDFGKDQETFDTEKPSKSSDTTERTTKRARRARHEVFVPSILGPSTLEATSFSETPNENHSSHHNSSRVSFSHHSSSSSITGPSSSGVSSMTSGNQLSSANSLSTNSSVSGNASGSNAARDGASAVEKGSGSSSNSASRDSGSYSVTPKKSQKQTQEKKHNKKRKSTKQNDTSPQNIPIDPDEPLYCLCDQVSYGEMIGCDNDLCPIEWFHFSCVSLTTKPKGKWYCPKCRGDRPNIMKPKAIFLKELEKYNREKEEKA